MRIGNRGQVLLIFVAVLLALLGFAALGIDVGYMYTVRHELQRSTDAGALAGASAFFDGSWSDSAIRALADARARAFAYKDKVATSTLSASGQVTVGFPAAERVRVDASRNVPLFFSRIFLGPTKTIAAYSVAEASAVGTNVKGLKPWGIPYPWDDTNGNGRWDDGEAVHYKCESDESGTYTLGFCDRTRIILKIGVPQNSPKNDPLAGIPTPQVEPGHFFCLALDGTGGSVYRDTIVTGSDTPVKIGDAVTLEPGNKVGPTKQGVNDLIADDPSSSWPEGSDHPVSSDPRFQGENWLISPRLVRIPIYDPIKPLDQGRTSMIIADFVGFWIEGLGPQGTVIGRYKKLPAPPGAGPTQGPSDGPTLRVLRLVE